MEQATSFFDHYTIKEAASKIIIFVTRGSFSLKDSLAIQGMRKALLLLKDPIMGIVQQYKISVLANLEGSLKDWAYKATQAVEVQEEFDHFQFLVYSSKVFAADLAQRIKSSQASTQTKDIEIKAKKAELKKFRGQVKVLENQLE